jgi:SAM-dependent methyltransferase
MSPVANNLVDEKVLGKNASKYPLRVMTCEKCKLVQLSEALPKELLFSPNYTYSSSYSTTWLKHSKNYVEKMINELKLTREDRVIEVASNDGYLLQYFKQNEIDVLGIEPASGVAKVAINKGINTLIDYFGQELAEKLAKSKKAKLMIGNNVLAHVPDLHDFISGFATLLADDGIITFEFPHLLNLIKEVQFDTIYHEHYSYLSLSALQPIFLQHNLKIINVEKLKSHGGSLRIFVVKNSSKRPINESIQKVIDEENRYDPINPEVYETFRLKVYEIKLNLLAELNKCKKNGKSIAAYGAAAKGVTLLNYCGIDSKLIDFVIDLNPNKQGKLIPGVNIPITDLRALEKNRPDILLILPWNLFDEIKNELTNYLKSGLQIFRAIPSLEYF